MNMNIGVLLVVVGVVVVGSFGKHISRCPFFLSEKE